MILALLAATTQPVEAAERAFASAAQTRGLWTAFRAFAAPDAIMLLDGPKPAAPFLAGRKDPRQALMWWPARTVTSCDGTLALSTGPYRTPDGASGGRYITLWRHSADGWRWIYDGGTDEKNRPAADQVSATRGKACRKPKWPLMEPDALAGGHSDDDSLRWRLDKADKGYRLRVFLNVGSGPMIEEDAIVGG